MVYKITETMRKGIENAFSKLTDDVELLLFTSKRDQCLACNELEELVTQITELSPKIKVTTGLSDNSEQMLLHQIDTDKHPALVIHGAKEYKIRYFGVPSGLELNPFIQTIVTVSRGDIDLPQPIVENIASITDPVHIQVFTTPTCPYCPKMVEMSHKFAMTNDNITSDMIDAMEFRELAIHYGVYGVPKTVINTRVSLDGLVSLKDFVDAIFEALKEREMLFHV